MAWFADAARMLRQQCIRQNTTQVGLRSRFTVPRNPSGHRQLSHQSGRATRKTPLDYYRAFFEQQQCVRLRRVRDVRNSSNKPSPDPTPHLGSPEPTSLSQRMKKLSREYGWSAVGVYFMLSALDFPFCFLAVRLLGTERIGEWEHAVVQAFWSVAEIPFPNIRKSSEDAVAVAQEVVADPSAREGSGWGVEEAQKANTSERASTFEDTSASEDYDANIEFL